MRIGSKQKNAVLSPSARWKDRFHRTGLLGELSIFVSRPTFDLLRRNDDKGKTAYAVIKKFVESLRDDEAESTHTHFDNGRLSGLRLNLENESLFCMGPFNVNTEMNRASKGLLIHLEVNVDSTDDSDKTTGLEIQLRSHFEKMVAQLPLDETGSKDSENIFKILYSSDTTQINPDAYDLAAARLLPSEPLIDENYKQTTFRQFLLRQFNEVRLHDDSNKVNVEQVRAIDMYEYSKSTLLNLSGRPGTGKSTILHILVCEALLQKGPMRGERRLLYLATTLDLLREARNEIKGLLTYVYELTKNLQQDMVDCIDFVTEEDLYIRAPSSSESSIQDREALLAVLEKIRNDKPFEDNTKKWKHWTNPANVDTLQRVLRNFVYGVFGSPSEFCKWVPQGMNDQKIKQRFERPFNLLRPFDNKLAESIGSDELGSDIDALYFWDPDFSDTKLAARKVRELCHLLEKPGGLSDYLIDLKRKKMTGLWDPSGLIHRDQHEFSFHEIDEDDELKKRTQTHGWDGIFVDESQDFSIKTLSTLLSLFSNRGLHRKNNFNPFTFVAVGDEYQTIRGTLFQGGMLHINKLITDWTKVLISESVDSTHTLSENLPLPQKKSLRANYRNFEQAVAAINKIVEYMRGIAQKTGKKRAIKLNEYDVERTGVIARIPPAGASPDSENVEVWEEILRTLLGQLTDKFDSRTPVEVELKVSMIYPLEQFTNVGDVVRGLRNVIDGDVQDTVKSIFEEILEFTNHQIEKYEDKEEVLGKLSEAGLMDIASIKGLTVPTVIALQPPIVQEGDPWFVNMQRLALSLVMISRPQFGLFIAASKNNYKKLTGTYEEYNSTLPDDLNFKDRLANASVPETPPERLFNSALNNWYNKRTWQRVTELEHISGTSKEFARWLQSIHIKIRNDEINEAINELEKYEDFVSNKDDIDHYLDASRFIDKGAIFAAKFFLSMHRSLRDLLKHPGAEVHLGEIRDLWLEIEKAMVGIDERPRIAKEANAYRWMRLIFGQLAELPTGMESTPWDAYQDEQPNFESHIRAPDVVGRPRLKISPWKFSRPPHAEPEQFELWMSEETRWTPSSKILRKIANEFLQKPEHYLKRQKTEWFLNFLENDAKQMLEASTKAILCDEPDFRELHWLQSFCLNLEAIEENPNKETYFYNQLRVLLESELSANDKVAEAVSRWVLSQKSGQSIQTCLKHIASLSSEKKTRKREILRHLDTKSILIHWLNTVNVRRLVDLAPEIKFLFTVNDDGLNSAVVEELSHLLSFNNRKKQQNPPQQKKTSLQEIDYRSNKAPEEAFLNALLSINLSKDFNRFEGELLDSTKNFTERMFAGLLLHDAKSVDESRLNLLYSELTFAASHLQMNLEGEHRANEVLSWFESIKNPSGFDGAELLLKSINEVKEGAHDVAFRTLMRVMKEGSFVKMEPLFSTHPAQCIRLHKSIKPDWPYNREMSTGLNHVQTWRFGGHNWNWKKLPSSGVRADPTERFGSPDGIAAISNNIHTFTAYILLDRFVRTSPDGIDRELIEAHLIKGGALNELSALRMYDACSDPEKSINDVLTTYCDVLDLNRQMYLMHLEGGNQLVSSVPINYIPPSISREIFREYGNDLENTIDLLPRYIPGEASRPIQNAIVECEKKLKPYFLAMNNHNLRSSISQRLRPNNVDLNSPEDAIQYVSEVVDALGEATFQAYPDEIFTFPDNFYDVEFNGRRELALRFVGGSSMLTQPTQLLGWHWGWSPKPFFEFLKHRVADDEEMLIKAICREYGVPGFQKILSQKFDRDPRKLLEELEQLLEEQKVPAGIILSILRAIEENKLDASQEYIIKDKLGNLAIVDEIIELMKTESN